MSGIEAAFIGTLSRDGEAKVSKNGKAYLQLNVRVGDGDGSQWIAVRLFGDCASDLMSKALLKGSAVYIEGRLSLDTWEAADGSKRTGLSVMSWFARPCAIHKPARVRTSKPNSAGRAGHSNDFYNDPIGI